MDKTVTSGRMPNSIQIAIAAWLDHHRVKQGIKPSQLARELGTTQQNIDNKIRKTKPRKISGDWLLRLAKAVGRPNVPGDLILDAARLIEENPGYDIDNHEWGE